MLNLTDTQSSSRDDIAFLIDKSQKNEVIMRLTKNIILLLLIAIPSLSCAENPSVENPSDLAVEAQVSETSQVDRRQEARRLNELGISAYKSKEYQKAINFYQKALTFDSSDASILNNLALAMLKSGDIENSIKVSIQVAELASNPSEKAAAFFNIGIAHENLDQFKNAAKAYDKSCQLKPNEFRCEKSKDLKYSLDVAGRIDSDLTSRKLKPWKNFTESARDNRCEELIAAIENNTLLYIRPDYVSHNINDAPFVKLNSQVDAKYPIHQFEANVDGIQEARSNFRLYLLNVDSSNDGSDETIFFGDDWAGNSKYKIYRKVKNKMKRVYSVLTRATYNDNQPIPGRFSEIAKHKDEYVFISIKIWQGDEAGGSLTIFSASDLTLKRSHLLCMADIL